MSLRMNGTQSLQQTHQVSISKQVILEEEEPHKENSRKEGRTTSEVRNEILMPFGCVSAGIKDHIGLNGGGGSTINTSEQIDNKNGQMQTNTLNSSI